jgi:hypothetical protein
MDTTLTPSAARGTAPTARLVAGRVLSGLAVLFLVFDGVTKLMQVRPVTEAMAQLGFAPGLAPAIGAVLLVCVALYVTPRTAALGAVLLTGFLGGAVAINLRAGNPLLSHVLFPVYVGAMVWGGLYLRDPRVRALLAPR